MDVLVRKLKETDVKALAQIQAQAFSRPWTAQILKELLDKRYCTYLVAEVEGKVVGGCGFTNCGGEGDIGNMVVAEEYRRQGVASRLLEELLLSGAKDDIADFTLEVRVSNEAAIHLYEKYGFVSEGIRPGFYDQPREDAVIMWRRKTK